MRYANVVPSSGARAGQAFAHALREVARRPVVTKLVQFGAGATLRRYSSPVSTLAGSCTSAALQLTAMERGTLDLGFCLVMGAASLGLGFGRWPAWTLLVAVSGYVVWVIVYSEITIQASRLRDRNRLRALQR